MFGLILTKLSFWFFAAEVTCTPPKSFFFFLPSWWEYLPGKIDALGQCSPSFTDASGKFALNNIWLIGLAALDILLRLAGFVAVISIMVAGAQHLFTGGNPEKAATARRRLYNSLIGLAIALVATAIVTFIGNQLGP